jgi:polyisoprenoid-binding protein YceI
MDRRNLVVVIGVAAAVLIGGILLFNAFLGETEEAGEPISAIPLELNSAEEATNSGQETADQQSANDTPAEGGLTVYTINQDNSEAAFTLSEVLRGSPTTVVGTTDQVAGEIAVDLNDLSTAQVGTIQVNARTLETPESRRNQTIRNRILFTDQYEFITFAPTEIVGLAGSAAAGQPLTFQIVGELTIRDITRQVTFNVTAQVDGNGQLVGTAETVVNRTDFELNIPSVPFVADVSEEVTLGLNFVAAA